MCGAAPLSAEIEKTLRRRLPNLDFIGQGWGMTETSLAVTLVVTFLTSPHLQSLQFTTTITTRERRCYTRYE